MDIKARLAETGCLILDGAIGSELESRGVKTELPLWSAVALLSKKDKTILRNIHADYIRAGADVITANTFRTNQRTLLHAGFEQRAHQLTRAAVDEARAAIDETGSQTWVAGSIAPVEDCYHPERVPSPAQLYDEHRHHIDNLYESQVDLLLIESMNTIREAQTALAYAVQTGLPVFVSFIGGEHETILSGESFEETIGMVQSNHANAMLINCTSPAKIEKLLPLFKSVATIPIGVYANVMTDHNLKAVISPEEYSNSVLNWVKEFKLRIAGGCCGTTPEHIRQIKNRFDA